MKKKITAIILMVALVLALAIPMAAVPVMAATDRLVPTGYATIQAAIDDAVTGDTIIVAAGTYDENVVIPPGKDNLQLIGAGSSVTSIEPASGKPVALSGNLGLINGFAISGFTLVTTGGAYAFLAGSGTPNDTAYTTDLELEDIVVTAGTYGIGLNAVDGVTLTNVHISNISGGGQGALELTGVSDLTFTDGSIEGNTIGVRLQPTGTGEIGAGYGPNGNIQIHNSNLTGNTMAVQNLDSSTVIDATGNWWGSITGPTHASNPLGTGDEVSDYVDFTPWLTGPWTGGSVGLTIDVPDIVAISVSPSSIDFGTVLPGETVNGANIYVTNIGTHEVDVDASIPGGTVLQNLELAPAGSSWLVKNWPNIITDLPMGQTAPAIQTKLPVPPGYTPSGTEEATLLFIARASS